MSEQELAFQHAWENRFGGELRFRGEADVNLDPQSYSLPETVPQAAPAESLVHATGALAIETFETPAPVTEVAAPLTIMGVEVISVPNNEPVTAGTGLEYAGSYFGSPEYQWGAFGDALPGTDSDYSNMGGELSISGYASDFGSIALSNETGGVGIGESGAAAYSGDLGGTSYGISGAELSGGYSGGAGYGGEFSGSGGYGAGYSGGGMDFGPSGE